MEHCEHETLRYEGPTIIENDIECVVIGYKIYCEFCNKFINTENLTYHRKD